MSPHFYTTLTKFSSKDWSKFSLFLMQRTDSRLLQALVAFLSKNISGMRPGKQEIYAHVYQQQPYNDNRYRQLMHRLQEMVDNYILLQREQSEPKDQLSLIQLEKNPKRRYSIKRALSNQMILNRDSVLQFKTQLYIEMEKQTAIESAQNRTQEPNYRAVHQCFDRLFLLEKLKLTCGALSFAQLNQYDYDFSLIETLEPFCNSSITEEDGILHALYKTYLVHKYNREDEFLALLHFFKKRPLAKSEETDLVYKMAGNFAIRQINRGKHDYFDHLFSIYQSSIESDCIKNIQGEIPLNTFLNILTAAFRLKKMDWSKSFLDSHIEYLPPASAETGANYLYARWHFENEQYEQALKRLSVSEPDDFFSNLLYRVLQIKCFYESDETDLVSSTLENYRIYLLRHKSHSYHFKLQSNFIRYLKSIHTASGSVQLEKIRGRLTTEKEVAEKVWLLQQLK
jgi:hypothetical protein